MARKHGGTVTTEMSVIRNDEDIDIEVSGYFNQEQNGGMTDPSWSAYVEFEEARDGMRLGGLTPRTGFDQTQQHSAGRYATPEGCRVQGRKPSAADVCSNNEGKNMKIITATGIFNKMGREECLRGISIATGKWAVFIRPSGRIEALNWRTYDDPTWGQFLAVVAIS